MKVAVLSYCGTVGKTTLSAHFLSPRMDNATVYSIESINETAKDLGIDIDLMKGKNFGTLFKKLMLEDDAIIDVGASNIEDFIENMIKYEDSHEEFDCFLIPIIPSVKAQKESINTIDVLSSCGIPPEKIKIVYNRVENSVEDEFSTILAYAEGEKKCTSNINAAIFENEIYDMLASKRLTISSVLNDDTDYRGELKSLDKSNPEDRERILECVDMIALCSLAKRSNKELNKVFTSLFN